MSRGLFIRSAITLVGRGTSKTVLRFPLSVSADAAGELLHLSHLSVVGHTVEIACGRFERVWLQQVKVDMQQGGGREDALTLSGRDCAYKSDRVLLEECEVRGGGDGVMINVSLELNRAPGLAQASIQP